MRSKEDREERRRRHRRMDKAKGQGKDRMGESSMGRMGRVVAVGTSTACVVAADAAVGRGAAAVDAAAHSDTAAAAGAAETYQYRRDRAAVV